MSYTEEFFFKAVGQIEALQEYIAAEALALVAKRYTEAIVDYGEGMQTFPHQGTVRDNPALHRLLALLDALRTARAHERTLAAKLTETELMSAHSSNAHASP